MPNGAQLNAGYGVGANAVADASATTYDGGDSPYSAQPVSGTKPASPSYNPDVNVRRAGCDADVGFFLTRFVLLPSP